MTKHRVLLWMLLTVLLAAVVIPAQAAPAPKEPTPKVGAKAGSISALLPVATITRGAGRAAVTNEAKKGDELVWNDLVKTLKGGRARITLTDQSILSMGAQSELKIVKHDSASQQTALALGYGRLRAEVTKIARQGGSFELKTPTAVAGVIGTDFGTESGLGNTTFLCISGLVQVGNVDPNVAGSVQCAPGMTTSVAAGKPPTIPTAATQEQIQKLIEDTEPALIAAMSPTSSLPGVTVDATISGDKLAGIKKADISGGGVVISMVGAPTATSVTVHLVINKEAAPGPRTISLTKQSGANSTAVFTILAPPTPPKPGVAAGIDPKKPYHDVFEQERQSARAGLGAYVVGAQQAADLALQQLQQANQGAGVDLTQATSNFNSQVAAVQQAVNDAGGQVNAAKGAADSAFDAQYQTAYNALLQRNPDGTPDDTFNQALLGIFNQVNADLGSAFNSIRSNLAGAQQTASSNIAQVQANWTSTISTAAAAKQTPPTPAVNNIERSIDVGGAFGGTIAALDAANSKGSNGASIIGYKWVLCDSSYKPAQFGVPIAANATGCNPVSGYSSTSSDFSFPTCNLNPADYIARLTVTDSNNQSAAMDVKVHVLAPTYSDPATVLLNLGQAYDGLNVNTFLSYFDQTAFAGFTALQENVRNTFPLLGSMSVNPVVSQASISCNDATVRADWNQKYYFKQVCTANPANPQQVSCVGGSSLVFSQTEQISARMTRTPGKGWYITDFQGDNGKVQGQLPGPSFTDNPQPDLEAHGVYPTYAGQPNTTPIPVPPGAQSFSAIITNAGGADLTAATSVRFTLQDATGAPINGTVDVPLSLPLKSKESQTVSATLSVPANVGQAFTAVANVNPGCAVTEAHCDAANLSSDALFVGTPVKLGIISSPLAFLSGGPAQTLQVSVSDASSVSLALPAGFTTTSANPQVFSAGGGTASWVLSADFNAAIGTSLTMTVTANASGINVPLKVPYSLTGPTFMTPTQYPLFIAGGTTPMPVVVCATQPVTGVTLNLPAGFTLVSGKNPQSSMAATGSGCPANAGNVLLWTLTASLNVAPTPPNTQAMMTTVVGQFPYQVPYEVIGPVMAPPTTTIMTAGGTSVAFDVGVTQPGSYTVTTPTGITASPCTTQSANTCTFSVTSPGVIPWTLTATFAAAQGSFNATSTLKVSAGGVYATPPIPYTVNTPFTGQGTPYPSLTVGEASAQAIVTTVAPGQYRLTLPTGIATSSPNPQSPVNGTLTWDLKADFTPGLSLSANPQTTTVTALLPGGADSLYTYAVTYLADKPSMTPGTPPVLPVGGAARTLTFTTNARNSWFMLSYPIQAINVTTTYPVFQQPSVNGTLQWEIQANTNIGPPLPSLSVVQMTNSPANGGAPSQYSWPAGYSISGPNFSQNILSMNAGDQVQRLLQFTSDAAGGYALATPTGITATFVSNSNGSGTALNTGGGTITWSVTASINAAGGSFTGGWPTPPGATSTMLISSGQYQYHVIYTVLPPNLTPGVLPTLVAGGSQQTLTATSTNSKGPFLLNLPPGSGLQVNSGLNPQTAPQTSPPYSVSWVISATPTATITSGNLTISAGTYTPWNVPYTVQALGFTPPLSPIQLTAGGPGPIATLSGNINDVGTYSLVTPLPTGIAGFATGLNQVTAAPGLVGWDLQADFSAVEGTGNVVVTNGFGGNVNVGYVVNRPSVVPSGTWLPLVAGGAPQTIQFTSPVPGTFRLGVGGTGTNIVNGMDQTITAPNGGTLSWDLQAIATAATGPQTVIVVALTPSNAPSAYIWNRTGTGPLWTYVVNAPGAPGMSALTLDAGGASQALTATTTAAGNYTLTLPANGSVSFDPAYPTETPTQSSPVGGRVITWHLLANLSATAGSKTDINIGNGTNTWAVSYTVQVPSYVITSVVVSGHTPDTSNSFLGAQGFQVGETLTENIIITNNGNGSATNKIVVSGSCKDAANNPCPPGPSSLPVDAPAAGQSISVPATLTWQQGLPTGKFTGSLALSDYLTGTPIPLATPATADYEVVDFYAPVLTNNWTQQNVIVPAAPAKPSAHVPFSMAEPAGITPFGVPMTATFSNGSVTVTPSFSPASVVLPGTGELVMQFDVVVPGTPESVKICGSNRGVSKCSADQALNFTDVQFQPTATSFVNDASNPLVVSTPQTVPFKLGGLNLFSGVATLPPPPQNGGFLASLPTTAPANSPFDVTFSATPTANTTITQLTISAQIPQTQPPASVSQTIYVVRGVPDLQVLRVAPARTINASNPWLAGEAIDFQVDVKNNGTASTSASLTMKLGDYIVASQSVTLDPAAQPTTLSITAIAPDFGSNVPQPKPGTPSILNTKILSDVKTGNKLSVEDLNYTDNVCSGIGSCSNGSGTQTSVPAADWRISVTDATGNPGTTGSGSGDGSNALLLQPTMASLTYVGFAVVGGGKGTVPVTLIPGAVTTGILTPSFGTNPLDSSLTSPTSLVTINSTSLPPNGYAYAQVIAQIGAAKRQASIHLMVGATTIPQIGITVPTGAPNYTTSTLQLNGPLAERFTFAPTCTTACNNGGSVDLTINDTSATNTTPSQILQASLGSPPVWQTITITAAMDANGEIMGPLGTASGYGISATGTTINARRGSTSPSQVGQLIALNVKVGDIALVPTQGLSASACASVPPGGPGTVVSATWDTTTARGTGATGGADSGFNAAVSWQIVPSTGPVTFSNTSGTAAPPYSSSVSATLTATQPFEGLYQYAVEITISNGISSATKYIPFYIDASTAQTFCSATNAARGSGAGRLRGTWNRSAITLGPVTTSAARTTSTSGALPDLHISASDVSYTPSMPKPGDAVQVRFRVSNQGTADAVSVPIALQINGATVAVDTFSVAAGRTTLAGLQWNGVLPAGAAPRMIAVAGRTPVTRSAGKDSLRSRLPADDTTAITRVPVLSAMVVVDPQHTIQQKSTLEKSAPLAHFGLHSAEVAAADAGVAGSQRILLELADGACVGLRMVTGSAGPCGSADAELNVDDKGGLSLNTLTGIADLGASFGPATSSARLDPARLSSSRYVSQIAALAGHSYAVQLSAGRTAVLTVVSVRNPGELDAKARALFRASALRILSKLGGSTAGPTGPGEVAAGATSTHTVFVELVVQTQ